jgi:replicative DNA helicase
MRVAYSEESEKAVLGSVLGDPSVIEEVLALVGVDDFFVPSHREIFSSLISLASDKKPIEVLALHGCLVSRGTAESVGSPGILAEILTAYASSSNVAHYAREIKSFSLIRALSHTCSKILTEISEDGIGEISEMLARSEAQIIKITRNHDTSEKISIVGESISRWTEQQRKVQLGEIQSRLATGFREFDAMNGGLMPEGMHVIAGRPGSGKSDFMFCAIRNIAKRGVPVGILQLEMTEGMMIERLMADEASIDSRRFHAPMTLPEWDRVYSSETEASKWPMFIECGAGFDINKIRRSIRALVAKGCKVIMLDYLQLAKSLETKYGNREQALAEVSRTIKGLTLEFGIAILVGSQLNRLDAGGKQGLHNLRESDSIGNDADVVIVLRKKTPDDESLKPHVVVDVAKYRNGAAGEIVMIFDMARHRFEDFQLPAQRPLYDPAP